MLPLRGKILNVEKARFDKMLSNEEIRMLISALGTGIGKENVNADKIRYHKIVIMTDADVDGSHIRTLLLTFFYRQMPAIVERGYVYIAQPPLYRVKKGNVEKYIKDKRALTEHLLEASLSTVRISNMRDGVSEAEMKRFILDVQRFEHLLKVLSSKFDREFLYFLVSQKADLHRLLESQELIDGIMAKFKDYVETNALNGILDVKHVLERDEEHKCFALKVLIARYGHRLESAFGYDVASSTEWMELSSLWLAFEKIVALPIRLMPDKDKDPLQFATYGEFMHHVIEGGKKGNYIQRYKGLGEMNPVQLWETTLNPENRALLKVTIDDAIAADETFSVLMGEQVEPRRKFIHDNALLVRELDV